MTTTEVPVRPDLSPNTTGDHKLYLACFNESMAGYEFFSKLIIDVAPGEVPQDVAVHVLSTWRGEGEDITDREDVEGVPEFEFEGGTIICSLDGITAFESLTELIDAMGGAWSSNSNIDGKG